ncbi:MAG TPA: PA14 domain-containing protein [Candidatus Paceibacterota bacterium]|nr:PA14 domain-containing protein [Candidatus Paceibacterota bacterium]
MSKGLSKLGFWMLCLGWPALAAPAWATYVNPLMTYNTPDPWVYYTNGYYYHTRTTGGSVRVFRSTNLQGLATASAVTVFSPNGEILRDIWAPELHYLDGKWYIYSTGNTVAGTLTMRMFVLEGDTQNPQGSYTYKGLVDPNLPAIDATLLVRPSDQARFLVWSQFDSYGQSLYIAPLSNPWTPAAPGVRLSRPTYSWEKNGNVNEGPEILRRNDKTFIIYSASGTWTEYYCMGLLMNMDGNYTNPASWTKFSNPVFQRAPANGTWCVGHGSFTRSPSGTEDWLAYHGTSDPTGDQTPKRYTRIQRFWWYTDDTPNFDVPTPPNTLLLSPDEAPGRPAQGLRGEFFNNAILGGAAVLTTNYTMDFDWGTGAPCLSIGTNQFSARWTGKLLAPVPGLYLFQLVNDDGARLWVNGQLLVDDWSSHTVRTNTASVNLTGGEFYDVRLEYYENTGSAVVRLQWIMPGGTVRTVPGQYLFPFTNGLRGDYFADTNLTQRVMTRLDPHVNFNWGSGIAALGVPADRFSVRWTGRVMPRFSELYTFHVNSANGRRLWINNQLVVDQWLDDRDVEYSGAIALEAGQTYDLKLEYFGNLGNASCQLSWESVSQNREPVPTTHLFPPFNQPPTLAPVPPQTVLAGRTLNVTNVASDPDVPAQTLTFSLVAGPLGAGINPSNGVFSWRPAIAQAGSEYPVSLAVMDSGLPPMGTTQAFTITVLQPMSPTLTWAGFGGGTIGLVVSGDSGPDYVIEATTHLPTTNWVPLFVTNSPPVPFRWEVEDLTRLPQQFYRVRLAP